MLDLLKRHFGFDGFRPNQEEIIASVVQGRDALVVMPTGSGKSLCYQLPALQFDGLTLVVSPLIALMKDQVDSLAGRGIAADLIDSSLSRSQVSEVQTRAIKGGSKILYVAPERLATSGFRRFLQQLRISLIAIDEAHCISEWGHDFRPDYRNLRSLREDFRGVPMIALTATATEDVRKDIIAQLEMHDGGVFVSSFDRPNLRYLVEPKRQPFERLMGWLKRHWDKPAIVYRFSRKDTESLAERLRDHGVKALPYHAGLDSDVRKETQERFLQGEVPVIVATIAFGMGIDKADIRLVVHYEMPKSIEGYYQETGRAGRDGEPSDCVFLHGYHDRLKHKFFVEKIEDAAQRAMAEQKLGQVAKYGDLLTCRRRYLLSYFGEEAGGESCGNCDVCQAPKEAFDVTVTVQKVLSAVVRTGERFGADYVISVLRGSKSKRLATLGHDQLSVYGIAREEAADELRQLVQVLLDKELLQVEGERYPTLAVTSKGRSFLKNREKLVLERRLGRDGRAPADNAGDGRSQRGRRFASKRPVSGETYLETKRLMGQKLSVEEVAQRHQLSSNTIITHLERLIASGEAVDISHLLPVTDRVEEIKQAFEKVGTDRLAPVLEALGGEYSYAELRLVRLKLRQDGTLA